MSKTQIRLSIEELAYAMGVLGGEELASGYLLALLGERARKELQGRLMAAAHSLAARDMLDFDPVAGIRGLSSALASAIKPLIQSDFSLRLSRTAAGEETTISFYFHEGCALQHHVERTVVAVVEPVPGSDEMVRRCASFFGLELETGRATPTGTIAADLLERARCASSSEQQDAVVMRMAAGGLPISTAHILVRDLAVGSGRGSVLRIQPAGDQLAGGAGFMLLCAPHHAWLFEMDASDPSILQVYDRAAARLPEALTALTQRCTSR